MNILLIILVIYVLITPFFYAKAVKFGMRLVEAQNSKTKMSEIEGFRVIIPKKKPKMTAEEDRMTQILRNIDNYNGDSKGQVKVEVKHD